MSSPKTIPGVDVASFEGPPGTWQQAAGRIKWVAVKITELQPGGTRYVNPDAAADWAYAAAKLLGRIAYLFGHPAVSPADTVSFFAETLDPLGVEDSDVIAIDLETTDGLAPAQVDAWGAEVASLLHARYGRVAVLYTYLSFAEEGNTASLGHLPLWISEPSSPPGQPIVPAPWTTWAIHQYETGGQIDKDMAAYPTVKAMAAALGKPAPQPPPQGATMKLASSVTLDGAFEVRPDRQPVTLRWAAAKDSPSLLGPAGHDAKFTAADVLLSSVNLHLSDPGVRITVTVTGADGAELNSPARDYREAGGWVMLTGLVEAVKDGSAVVTVTNFGSLPVKVTGGYWMLAG